MLSRSVAAGLRRRSGLVRCVSSKPSSSLLSSPSPSKSSSTSPSSDKVEEFRRLDVAIVGAPNAGKSQLLNVLTDTTVAAVSRKRHTTRTNTLGARTVGNTQISFVDTPGFLRLEHAKEERLDRELLISAGVATKNVDFTLLVVDAARKPSPAYLTATQQLIQNALQSEGREEDELYEVPLYKDNIDAGRNKDCQLTDFDAKRMANRAKFAIVLNKVDLVNPKAELLETGRFLMQIARNCILHDMRPELYQDVNFRYLLEDIPDESLPTDVLFDLGARAPFVYYVSAIEEDGTDELMEDLLRQATPCRAWRLERNVNTELTELARIEEIVREKIYRCLHREVPHAVTQRNRLFEKKHNGDNAVVLIQQDLVVGTRSHQRLVYGRNGETLKRIQETSVRDLSRYVFPDEQIELRLHVKLEK